jgi:hypothetical protein
MNFTFNVKAILKQSSIWDFPSFLETYTLHDSSLLEFRVRPSADVLVFIDWDLHWNAKIPSEFNLLVVRFVRVYWAKWLEGAWQQTTLGGATSKIVSEAEREQMLNDKRFDLRAYQNERDDIQAPMMDATLTRTVFDFVNWGECEILHSAEVGFACFDESGNLGEIPFEKAASV